MKLILFCLITLSISPMLKGQEVSYSNLETTFRLSNSAFNLMDGNLAFAEMGYKNNNKPGAVKLNSYYFLGQMKVRNEKREYFDVSVLMGQDKFGTNFFRTSAFDLRFSKRYQITTKSQFSIGISSAIRSYGIDLEAMTWDNQYLDNQFVSSISSIENITFENSNAFVVSSGLMFTFFNSSDKKTRQEENYTQIGLNFQNLNGAKTNLYLIQNEILVVPQFQLTSQFRSNNLLFKPYAHLEKRKELTLYRVGFVLKYSETPRKAGRFIGGNSQSAGIQIVLQNHSILSGGILIGWKDIQISLSADYVFGDFQKAVNNLNGLETMVNYSYEN